MYRTREHHTTRIDSVTIEENTHIKMGHHRVTTAHANNFPIRSRIVVLESSLWDANAMNPHHQTGKKCRSRQEPIDYTKVNEEELGRSAVLCPEIQVKLAILAWDKRETLYQATKQYIGIVVMAKSLDHAAALKKAFERLPGCKPAHVNSNMTPETRNHIRANYESGEFNVMILVGCYRVGWHATKNTICLPATLL
jgi:superfamily II DNA or RNA helicase